METTIYHHFNITSKTNIMTNTRALIYRRLKSFVPERIKHETLDMLAYLRKSSNPV